MTSWRETPLNVPDHPAPFSDKVLAEIVSILDRLSVRTILDPFAGIGRIHNLRPRWETWGVEREPEWAAASPYTITGDALELTLLFAPGRFDAIVTSPCLEQGQRILTSDLRWVPVGDIEVGDMVMAFDEHGDGLTQDGRVSRRRWRRAEVVRSVPKTVECVRVVLANGDEVITTPEHPWLADRYAYGGRQAEWVASRDLMGSEGQGVTRGHKKGKRQPHYVQLQVSPWTVRTSFDAGWLSGMYDGEGSLSLGAHGSPKLVVCQVEGPVADRLERLMHEFGYEPNRIVRKETTRGDWEFQKLVNLYVTGGFPGMMRALGELRPTRLLEKWEGLDLSTRTIQAEKVQVVAVEPAGRLDIQEIETTVGTYIGEGYLMHNCFGNRMADHHDAQDMSKRNTYRHMLGREIAEGSSAILQWGDEYREFHVKAWEEATALGTPWFILDIKDHVRQGTRQPVTKWHVDELGRQGWHLLEEARIPARGNRYGANRELRIDYETVALFGREA